MKYQLCATIPSRAKGGITISPATHEPAVAVRPSAARDRILATATRLFYSVGIRTVGVDRLIAESQVARMTFFRHFPTKDDLVVAFLTAQASAARDELTQIRQTRGPHALLAAVAAGITTATNTDGFRGCEFINTAAEFCNPNHPARVLIAQHRAWVRDQMKDALTALRHPTPSETAEILLMLRTGAIVAASLEGLTDTSKLEQTWSTLINQTSAHQPRSAHPTSQD
ncbi:TetR/AcrR family transcriptional regulator [Microlunatus elymi]|uniref:TetR/AcrR family transcriptional regulator n=1 Tax=Microlunatus elymi TaxID=2596828 RepID=UPI00143D30A7|nr:TetR/AcrR family transcriptional regulator [Microlunatus elymi]